MRIYDIDQDDLPNKYVLGEWETLEVYKDIVEYGELVEINHLW